jgi:N-acetylmuramic acid 6-phosphate (MurNAc-6-P) etherase
MSTRLHSATTQKTAIFILATVTVIGTDHICIWAMHTSEVEELCIAKIN